jgi:hypothetical protein
VTELCWSIPDLFHGMEGVAIPVKTWTNSYMPLHAVREVLLSEGCLYMPSGKLKLLKTHLKLGSTPTTHPNFSIS